MNSAGPDDTGGGSSYYAADPAEVKAAGGTLKREAGSIGEARTYGPIDGLVEGAAVEKAAEAMREAWGRALDAWQTSLTTLGEATEGAAHALTATDHSNAARWNKQREAFQR